MRHYKYLNQKIVYSQKSLIDPQNETFLLSIWAQNPVLKTCPGKFPEIFQNHEIL